MSLDALFYTHLLWDAIQNKDMLKCMLAIHKGADIHSKYTDGSPLLPRAVGQFPAIVPLLLELGVNPNDSGKYGFTALMKATAQGELEIVKLLLEYGADANATDFAGSNSLAYAEHKNIVKVLVKHTKDLNNSNPYCYTPLMTAVMKDDTELVQYLIDHGAVVDSNALSQCISDDMKALLQKYYVPTYRILSRGDDACT